MMKDSNFLLLMSIGWLIVQVFSSGVQFYVAIAMMNMYLVGHYVVRNIEKPKKDDDESRSS